MRNEREDSKVMVELLDFTNHKAEALAYWHEQGNEADRMTITNSHGIVVTDDGMFALCSEGVGSEKPVTGEEPFVLEFHSETDTGNGHSFSMIPVLTMKLDDEGLLASRSGEKVALHDFIRKFGDRLERNYGEWRRLLENKNLVEVAY